MRQRKETNGQMAREVGSRPQAGGVYPSFFFQPKDCSMLSQRGEPQFPNPLGFPKRAKI